MSVHNHHNPVSLGKGWLLIGSAKLEFQEAIVFLEIKDLDDEQRVCINFGRPVNLDKIIDKGSPFIELNLDKSYYPPKRSIPINKLSLFILSGVQTENNRIDFLVSPRNTYLDPMLHKID